MFTLIIAMNFIAPSGQSLKSFVSSAASKISNAAKSVATGVKNFFTGGSSSTAAPAAPSKPAASSTGSKTSATSANTAGTAAKKSTTRSATAYAGSSSGSNRVQSPGPVQSTAQNVNPYNVAQSTAQAVADARKAADYMNATAPGSPAAQQATRAYMETQRLASMANATHDPNIARQAVQASQASVNHTNNVATGRSPNTYSPYNSNGNATSYFNSSYQSGKAPSPDAPRIEDVTADSVYYCSIAKRVPNTNALGAGDYGSAALSQAWDSVVAWAKTDKGQKTLMTIASSAEIVGGLVLTVGVVGSGLGVAILGGALLGGGVSSLAGGWVSEQMGDSYMSGWLGGQAGGIMTGAGLGVGPALELSFASSEAIAVLAGTMGGTFGNAISQRIETEEVNWDNAFKAGIINGAVSAFAEVFNNVPGTILSDATTGVIGKIVGSGTTLINEIVADMSSTIISAGTEG